MSDQQNNNPEQQQNNNDSINKANDIIEEDHKSAPSDNGEEDVIYLEEEEMQELDQDEDDYQTINESDIGDANADYNEGQILDYQIIQDDSIAKFNEHKDSVFGVTLVPREPYNMFISGDCNDKAFVWKIVKDAPKPASADQQEYEEEKKQSEIDQEQIDQQIKEKTEQNDEKKPQPDEAVVSIKSVIVKELQGHTETVEFAKFNFDGKLLVTGGMNNKLRIWNTENNDFSLKYVLEDGPTDDLNFLEWHPKGNVFMTGGKDYLIWLFNGSNGTFISCLSGHEEEVLHAMFTLNDQGKHIVSSGADKTIRLWAPMKNQCLQVIRNTSVTGIAGKFHEADINIFSLHHERPLIVSGDIEGKVFYSHYQTGEIGALMGTHADSVESIAFNRIQPICVSAGIDTMINIYDLNTNEIRFKINPSGEYGAFTKLLFSQVQSFVLLAASTLGDFFLIDVRDGKTVKTFKGHAAPINDFVEVKQLELIVTGGDDNQCLVFDCSGAYASIQ